MSAMRICKFCGKAFLPTNPNAKYCNRTHTLTCEICGKEFVIPNTKLGIDYQKHVPGSVVQYLESLLIDSVLGTILRHRILKY